MVNQRKQKQVSYEKHKLYSLFLALKTNKFIV